MIVMAQLDHIRKLSVFGTKGQYDFFIGCHMHPGRFWSGYYFVREILGSCGFQLSINAFPHEVTIHRVMEVSKHVAVRAAVAEWRKQSIAFSSAQAEAGMDMSAFAGNETSLVETEIGDVT